MFSISAMPIERRVISLPTFESFSRFEQRLRQADTFLGYNAEERRTGFFIGETQSGAVAECTLNISGVADCIIVGNSVAGCKIYIQAVKIILPLSKF